MIDLQKIKNIESNKNPKKKYIEDIDSQRLEQRQTERERKEKRNPQTE